MAELPVFTERDWESHVSQWSQLEQREGMLKLEKGAVIHNLTKVHGEASIEDFAWAVGEPRPSTMYEYKRVYERLLKLGDYARAELLDALQEGTLVYSHIREASRRVKDDLEMMSVLRKSQDNDWRVRRLMEELAIRTMVRQENGSFTNAPGRDEHHVSHGENEFNSNGSRDEERKSALDEVPVQPSVIELELRRLRKQVAEMCSLLREKCPDCALDQIREMRRELENLEAELEQSSASLGGGN